MQGSEDNPLEDLCELLFLGFHSDQDENEKDIKFELRIGEITLSDDETLTFTVSAKRAFFDLDLEGMSVIPGTKFGDVIRPNEVNVQRKQDTRKESTVTAGGTLGVSSTKGFFADAEVGAKLLDSAADTVTRIESIVETRVTPRGGNKWEILEPNGDVLNGLYLDIDKALCRLRPEARANRSSVTARVYVKRRDMIYTIDPSTSTLLRRCLPPNKERILGIVLNKALNARSADPEVRSSGDIIVSQVETDYEG
jgi:hypothetical protein